MKRLFLIINILLCFSAISETYYVLEKGDTLYSVSRKHNITVNELISLNKIKDPKKIKIGTKLIIPGKINKNTVQSDKKIEKKEVIKYKIEKGDTLYSLSRKYNISVKDIIDFNNISKNEIIKPGDIIQIPQEMNKKIAFTKKKYPKYFWPHSGDRTKADGKLQGNYFHGKKGDPVYSVASGKVIWVAPYRGYKKIILIESPDSYIYVYGGNEDSYVSVGDKVLQGDKIGDLGVNIHENKALLFFSVFKNNVYINTETAPRG